MQLLSSATAPLASEKSGSVDTSSTPPGLGRAKSCAPTHLTRRRRADILAILSALTLAALYAPTLVDTARLWLSNDNYGHGVLVLPCCAFVLWLRRHDFAAARIEPDLRGLPILLCGVFVQIVGYTLQVKYVGMWSLAAACAGAILLIYGAETWKIARFAVCFTLFAAPFSGTVLSRITGWLQELSTYCAGTVMQALGFIVERHGNVLSVPNGSIEIADACSGFHKLISMLAFASLFGYLATPSVPRRLMLILVSVPIALLANIGRIATLVVATEDGGMRAFHLFHEPSDAAAIGVSFVLLVLAARRLGCGNIGNSQNFSHL